uniref:Uncharacterized protein n=1 Tax=Oryza brachyantha TaxID=4533 RepID=J3M5Q1_ORYBR
KPGRTLRPKSRSKKNPLSCTDALLFFLLPTSDSLSAILFCTRFHFSACEPQRHSQSLHGLTVHTASRAIIICCQRRRKKEVCTWANTILYICE